ncbi:MAG: hypothetical protein SYC29_02345 [Planctomycetota bacterium]|nr:hypothetical protein [Planctomycetota bacterium]
MSRRARIASGPVIFALLGALLVGCASSAGARGRNVTGGLVLEVYVQPGDGSFARYRVETDGRLRFGGGQDAIDRRFTWSGPMTEEEIGRLTALIDEHRWLETSPPSTGEPAVREIEVKLRKGGTRRSFTVIGESEAVTRVLEVLETAALRRHDEFLRRLPQPGEQH